MINRSLVFGFLFVLLVVQGVFAANVFDFGKDHSNMGFSSDTLFLKVALEGTDNSIRTLKIENEDSKELSFHVTNNECCSQYVTIDPVDFTLQPGEGKDIKVSFDTTGFEPSVYVGLIDISSNGYKKSIPVILELQSKDVIFDSNINLF